MFRRYAISKISTFVTSKFSDGKKNLQRSKIHNVHTDRQPCLTIDSIGMNSIFEFYNVLFSSTITYNILTVAN